MFGLGLYVKNSVEAVELYREVFGLELGYHVKNADGSYFHSELYRDGKEVLSVVESTDDVHANTVACLGYTFDTEEALHHAFDRLSEGGKVKMPIQELPWSPCAAEVIDKFGVWWYLTTPQHRPPDDFQPE